jgi:hypothetical protein
MPPRRKPQAPRSVPQAPRSVQAWIELVAADPEAVSALGVARAHLPAARRLTNLRRVRLIELTGPLPPVADVERLLHRSSQFYNPHKERCVVRAAPGDRPPLASGEHAVLVTERGGERHESAERWWRHETGAAVEVREGVAWILSFDVPERETRAAIEALTVVQDRRTGLLCNPHAQNHAIAGATIPLPWIPGASPAKNAAGRGGR